MRDICANGWAQILSPVLLRNYQAQRLVCLEPLSCRTQPNLPAPNRPRSGKVRSQILAPAGARQARTPTAHQTLRPLFVHMRSLHIYILCEPPKADKKRPALGADFGIGRKIAGACRAADRRPANAFTDSGQEREPHMVLTGQNPGGDGDAACEPRNKSPSCCRHSDRSKTARARASAPGGPCAPARTRP